MSGSLAKAFLDDIVANIDRLRQRFVRRSWQGTALDGRRYVRSSSTGSTSLTPWYVLKNTIKKTTVTPRATFDQIPSPNHTAKMGANITRGIALKALM